MTDSMIDQEIISYEDVLGVTVADKRLTLSLWIGTTISIPCDCLSVDHQLSGSKEHADIKLSSDYQLISWPQLGVTLQIDELLRLWVLHPRLARTNLKSDIDRRVEGDRTVSAYENRSSNEEEPGRAKLRQFKKTGDKEREVRFHELEERVKALENHADVTFRVLNPHNPSR